MLDAWLRHFPCGTPGVNSGMGRIWPGLTRWSDRCRSRHCIGGGWWRKYNCVGKSNAMYHFVGLAHDCSNSTYCILALIYLPSKLHKYAGRKVFGLQPDQPSEKCETPNLWMYDQEVARMACGLNQSGRVTHMCISQLSLALVKDTCNSFSHVRYRAIFEATPTYLRGVP